MGIPTKGLLDAVVYRQRGSDREAQELSKALTPGQLPLLEDPEVLLGDEALSRCGGLYPADLSAFSVSTVVEYCCFKYRCDSHSSSVTVDVAVNVRRLLLPPH